MDRDSISVQTLGQTGALTQLNLPRYRKLASGLSLRSNLRTELSHVLRHESGHRRTRDCIVRTRPPGAKARLPGRPIGMDRRSDCHLRNQLPIVWIIQPLSSDLLVLVAILVKFSQSVCG
jgi:hypothetical protein